MLLLRGFVRVIRHVLIPRRIDPQGLKAMQAGRGEHDVQSSFTPFLYADASNEIG